MTAIQISAADLSILNLAYYDSPLRVPGGNLKYKTQSLIAADQRLHAIRNACTDIAKTIEPWNDKLDCSHAIRATIEAMIDAGYRKFEIVEGE